MNRSGEVLGFLNGLSLAFGLLVLLNRLQIIFFLYYPSTTSTVLISAPLDQYTFLLSSLCVPASLLALRRHRSGIRTEAFVSLAFWFLGLILLPINLSYSIPIIWFSIMILAVARLDRPTLLEGRGNNLIHTIMGAATVIALIECASIYYWVTAAMSPLSFYGASSQDLETALTYSPYPVAPVLLLVVMFSWVWGPLLPRATRALRRSKKGPPVQDTVLERSGNLSRRLFTASFCFFATLAVLLFLFLYGAGQTWIVGVDSIWRYLTPLKSLSGKSASQAIWDSLKLGHGVYVAVLYLIQRATGLSAFVIVKFAPLLFAFLTPSFLFLALRRNVPYSLALLSALCAILWFPTTLGMWGGIQDNWAAYALWMLFLVPYLNGVAKFRIANFIAQSLLSLAIVILHPWSSGVFLATVVLSSLLSLRRRVGLRRSLTDILSVAWLTLPVGLLAYAYIPGIQGDLSNALSLYSSSLVQPGTVLNTFAGAWLEMFKQWSSFLSPALIIITLIGALALTEIEGGTKRYMLAWIAVWCLGSFLAAPLDYYPTKPAISETLLWRMLFLSPLPLLLALGVKKCVDFSSRLKGLPQNLTAWTRPAVFSATICATSLLLFVTTSPALRLISFLTAALAVLLLTPSPQAGSSVRVLLLIVLGLITANAAFRSLFPLLLNPHNCAFAQC